LLRGTKAPVGVGRVGQEEQAALVAAVSPSLLCQWTVKRNESIYEWVK
jgi:DNA-binding transcriptional regulator YdaS (Cro superfamily)